MNVRSGIVFVVFLSLLDIIFTHIILSIYIKKNPEDKNWPDVEFNKFARLIFKRYGLGIKSIILNLTHSIILLTTFFGLVYIFNLDLAFFVYATFGGLAFVNISHFEHYKRIKKM